jgi:hypothetical protein
MNTADKSKRWEVTPTAVEIPLAVVPNSDEGKAGTTTAKSMPTTIDAAADRAQTLLRRCRYLMRKPQVTELFKLLNDYPVLICDASVRDRLLQLLLAGRLRSARGNKPGRYQRLHPIVAFYLVEALRSETKCTQDGAFIRLGEEFHASRETIRRLYFEAKNDSRFSGVAVQTGPTTIQDEGPRQAAGLPKDGGVSIQAGPFSLRIESVPDKP